MTFGLYALSTRSFTDDAALATFTSIPAYATDLSRPDLSLVVAMELDAVTAADAGNSGTFYYGSEGFTTLPSNTPASQHFEGRIRSCILARSIERGQDGLLAGGLIRSFGEIELDNADGGLDDLLTLWYVDGRQCVIKAAGKDSNGNVRSYGSFGRVFIGTAGQWTFEADGNIVKLRLESVSRRLRRKMGTTAYLGTGGAEGISDLEGVSKPQTYGICYNVSPQLIDQSIRTYQCHDDFIEDVFAVYDSGVEIEFDGRYVDYATLSVQELTEGTYAISRTAGHLMLGADPVGQVTMDVEGDKGANRRPEVEDWSDGTRWSDGTGWSRQAATLPIQGVAQAIWRILEERAGFTSEQINESAFGRFDRAQPAQIGYHVEAGDTATIAEHIAELARSAGAAVGVDQYNHVTLVRVEAPSDNSPYDLNDTNIVRGGVARVTLPYGSPWYQWRVGYRVNWTIQNEAQLAATVSLSRKSKLKRPYLVTVASDTDVQTAFPAARVIEHKTYFNELEDAQAERVRLAALYSVDRMMLSVEVKTFLFRIELGETVKVTYDRFGLDSGRFFTVLEVEENLVEQTTRLLLFG